MIEIKKLNIEIGVVKAEASKVSLLLVNSDLSHKQVVQENLNDTTHKFQRKPTNQQIHILERKKKSILVNWQFLEICNFSCTSSVLPRFMMSSPVMVSPIIVGWSLVNQSS